MPDNIKPIVLHVKFQDSGASLRAVGLINNREFTFFTDDDRREWWYEMSLNPWISVAVCNPGDGNYWGIHNKWTAELPMNHGAINQTIRAIVKNLVKSGLLDRDNFDSFGDQNEEEWLEGA